MTKLDHEEVLVGKICIGNAHFPVDELAFILERRTSKILCIFLYNWFECLTTLRIIICRTKLSKVGVDERSPAEMGSAFPSFASPMLHASMGLFKQLPR